MRMKIETGLFVTLIDQKTGNEDVSKRQKYTCATIIPIDKITKTITFLVNLVIYGNTLKQQ